MTWQRQILLLAALFSAVPSIAAEPWITEFGQNGKLNFAGKIGSVEELKEADRREERELAQSAAVPNRSRYQGWTKGPRLEAKFFRTAKVDGRWWLVDPDGRLFYATGIDCISAFSSAKLDDQNRSSYKWLPPSVGEFAAAKGNSLYTANLIRKWGSTGFLPRSRERALARCKSWGFTSMGNWCDSELTESSKFPYVHAGPKTWECKVPYIDGDICDAFDPKFPIEAEKAASELRKNRNDKFLIGYFIDNELPWWNLGYDVLAMDPASHARRAFIDLLKANHAGSIQKLNRAWEVNYRSFDDVRWPGEKASKAAQKDLSEFREKFADRFFDGWYRAIKKADPNHLILGSRLPYPMDDVVRASARHTDVLSFNHYSVEPWPELDAYARQLDKPMLIGEYAFDSLDAGLLAAHVPVKTQKERGVGFRYLTENLAAKPYMIGSHYFQYVDEPITGRSRDGENSFNGFVNVADIPYQHMVSAARVTNGHIYDIHAGRTRPTKTRPLQ